ncbi:GNAT family N-acetyltransferase [Algibacillus agarilyticus]|uniref:GNAT family N-acetyltransferase n=1 Tax=Algibacillus agarilyticus TaxID=2234133 RepID=UPI000DD02456|nr:GNAT family N-acetyltransferase [Algibacillus agarilyticus]
MLHYQIAEEQHADILCDTLITSKGYWGYSQEQLDIWRSNLKFEAEYLAHNTVKLVMEGSDVIGFYAIVKGDINELDHLWLLPAVIGKGNGGLVFEQVLLECKLLDINAFYITSDPDAEGFYLNKGAIKVGEVYSEAQKRMLPKLKYLVAPST